MIPGATYRVQLQGAFTFAAAAEVVPYFARIGITHLYCSPILQASPGSTHGYDVVDPRQVSCELGGADGFSELKDCLAENGMGLMLDIVPNHMAVGGRANPWWWDVLENGPQSVHARHFDVEWQGSEREVESTVLAPVLPDHYGRVIERGEIRVEFVMPSFVVRCGEHELPVSPVTYDELLQPAAEATGSVELVELARDFRKLEEVARGDPAALRARHQRKERLLAVLRERCSQDPGVARALAREALALSHDADRLDHLLRRQNYRLAFWRLANEELDYRRFFNIETLVGVRVEHEEVFADTHALVLDLVRQQSVQGLRIDHVDGLRDPRGYLARLREEAGPVYTVVEKILGRSEDLPCDWPVQGTSGYDFLNRVNALFVDARNEGPFTACYRSFTGEEQAWPDVVHAAKHRVMRQDLRAEIESLTRLLHLICERHRRNRDHSRRELRAALMELLAAFDVYRTYAQPGEAVSEEDEQRVRTAVARAISRAPELDPELMEFLGELALFRHEGALETEFGLRLPQASAPVMAKGVEDTAFYRYNRLISLNEVGGDPGTFGRSVSDFHRATERAASHWPHAMLTLSTHDTKRSADVRARVNLLSELPEAWSGLLSRLARIADRHRTADRPDANSEYVLYQALVGAWPIDVERVVRLMEKSSREARVHTSWVDPVLEYDRALETFVRGVCGDSEFLQEIESFLRGHRIVELGRINSIAQTTLLLTCPGVPDIYQGTELWDYSLVDPDNRRPVDHGTRRRLLDQRRAESPPCVANDADGFSKLWLIERVLCHRMRTPAPYASSAYAPLEVAGEKSEHAVAFAREGLVVVVPRLVVGLSGNWGDTTLELPPGRWLSVLHGAGAFSGNVRLAELLQSFPVSVLEAA